MKSAIVLLGNLLALSAFAGQDLSGCDLKVKPGYAVCKMSNCYVGELTVPSCTVTFKVRKGDAKPQQPGACQPGEGYTPGCSSSVGNALPPSTEEQKAEAQKAYEKQVEESQKIGG